jgi:hypothetical protein
LSPDAAAALDVTRRSGRAGFASTFGSGASWDTSSTLAGLKPRGGHWNSGIAVLRKNGLIETNGRRYRTAGLFRHEIFPIEGAR